MDTVCLCLNLKNRAFTQFHKFNWASMCAVGYKGFMASEAEGLYSYEIGGDDDGFPINAFYVTQALYFGTNDQKHIRNLSFTHRTEGTLEVNWTEAGYDYKYPAQTTEYMSGGKHFIDEEIRGNRNIQGIGFNFVVKNVDGCDFEIKDMSANIQFKGGRRRRGKISD